jgi:NTP pyrophosphatase (non-canonical NTP hydrolase)
MRELIEKIQDFNRQRDWEQFHSPKNLAMCLAAEVGELLEQFQWLTEEQSRDLPPARRTAVDEEIGDVTLCLLNLADKLGIDPLDAATRKLRKNEAKYPVHKAKGRAEKYTEWEERT